MTIDSNPTRRSRRAPGYSSSVSPGGSAPREYTHVGERLREIRENRGLDLYRVERDTKIRHKFLAALEAGDYADLPGDVYVRGFLRNYASYLGLDPDEVVEEWKSESAPKAPIGKVGTGKAGPAASPAGILAAPRPMLLPRRGFFLQPSHMIMIGVVLIVAIVAVFFFYQMNRFLSYPTLSVGCPGAVASGALPSGSRAPSTALATPPLTARPSLPSSGVELTVNPSGDTCEVSQGVVHIRVPIGATTYLLTGTATPGSTVTVSWNGQDPKTVPATDMDNEGRWSFRVVVTPDNGGQNRFDIQAQGIDANHMSKVATVYIQVPSATPTPSIPVLEFGAPADGTSFADGKVTVTGTSSYVAKVTLTTQYVGPPPAPGASFNPSDYTSPSASASASAGSTTGATPKPAGTPTPAASVKPAPSASAPPVPVAASTSPDASGNFSFAFNLEPGVWRLTLTGVDAQGRTTTPMSRLVWVPQTGVIVTIKVSGGQAWMIYYRDGTALGRNTYSPGYTANVQAKKTVCVQTGKPGLVLLTVNGQAVGSVATFGGTAVLIDATTGPKRVSKCP